MGIALTAILALAHDLRAAQSGRSVAAPAILAGTMVITRRGSVTVLPCHATIYLDSKSYHLKSGVVFELPTIIEMPPPITLVHLNRTVLIDPVFCRTGSISTGIDLNGIIGVDSNYIRSMKSDSNTAIRLDCSVSIVADFPLACGRFTLDHLDRFKVRHSALT